MAWLSMDFSSKTLKRPVELEILLPQSGTINRVLFLLHGAIDNRMAWLMKSQIEYFIEGKDICVVMPDGMNSFYVNTHNAYQFMDFICEELPQLLKTMYYVPEDKNLWMIAGNSMGGYGALRCGLQAMDVFGYIASFSGALDIAACYEHCNFANMWNVFGEEEDLLASNNNLYKLIDNKLINNANSTASAIHKLLLTCGTEDDLLGDNQAFYEYLRSKLCVNVSKNTTSNGVLSDTDLVFLTKEGGHDWSFWNDSLKCAIDWFCGNECYKEGFTCQ